MKTLHIIHTGLLLIPVSLLFAVSLKAQTASENVILQPDTHQESLSKNLYIFIDEENKLTIEDIRRDTFQKQFKKNTFDTPVFPGHDSTIWTKITLENRSPGSEYYFYLSYFPMYAAEFFIPDSEGKFRHYRAGRHYTENSDSLHKKHIIIPAGFSDRNATVYIKFYNPVDSFDIDLYIADFIGISDLTSKHTSEISLYIALAASFFIYNLIIFFVIRQKAYIYYTLHIFFIASIFAFVYGLPQDLINAIGIEYSALISNLFANLAAILSALFFIEFLNVKKRSVLVFRMMAVIIAFLFLNLILTLAGWAQSQEFWFLLIIIGSFVQIVFALRYAMKDPYAAFYAVSWGLHLFIIFLYTLSIFGILDTGIRIVHIMFGNSFELFILTFALGYRFTNILKEKKEIEKKASLALQREDSLIKLSYLDALTEVYNRRKFDESLDAQIQLARTAGISFSLILMDIDHFKNINDRYGHDIGDHVLINFARTVENIIRKTDLFCRIGGEEFAILLENSGKEDASSLAEKLRQIVDSIIFIEKKDNVTVSCGVTEFKKKDSSASILKRADKALYRAKNNGRNRVELAS